MTVDSIHPQPHPLAGKQARVTSGHYAGRVIMVEDWQSRVYGGQSWMFADGNPSALMYAVRSATDDLPTDNEVIYAEGTMFHASEIEAVA